MEKLYDDILTLVENSPLDEQQKQAQFNMINQLMENNEYDELMRIFSELQESKKRQENMVEIETKRSVSKEKSSFVSLPPSQDFNDTVISADELYKLLYIN